MTLVLDNENKDREKECGSREELFLEEDNVNENIPTLQNRIIPKNSKINQYPEYHKHLGVVPWFFFFNLNQNIICQTLSKSS